MGPLHVGVGHVVVERGQAAGQRNKLQRVNDELQQRCRRARSAAGKRQQIRRGGQTGAQQQGPQRDGGPVNQHTLRKRPRLAHAPDAVERAVNRQHHGNRGDHQHSQTGHTQPAGLARKLRQVAQHLARNAVGNQALDQPGLQGTLQLGKHRKGREDGQRHREKRHQRNRGGEGQAAGRQAQMVLAKAVAQRDRGVPPREFRKVSQYLLHIHAGIMPPA